MCICVYKNIVIHLSIMFEFVICQISIVIYISHRKSPRAHNEVNAVVLVTTLKTLDVKYKINKETEIKRT